MNSLSIESKILRFALVATVFLFVGCQSTVDADPPKRTITFIDAQKFDNELTRGIFTNISYDDLKFDVNDIYSETLKNSFNNIYSKYNLKGDIYAIPLRMKLIML